MSTAINNKHVWTTVSSSVLNESDKNETINFHAVLPSAALINNFTVSYKDKNYYTGVEKHTTDHNVTINDTIAKGFQASDTNVFVYSVIVEPRCEISFELVYEYVLTRKLGFYENVQTVLFGQIACDLQVSVDIKDACDITFLKVSKAHKAYKGQEYDSVKVSHYSNQHTTILWAPNENEQFEFLENNLLTQLVVRYDVDHESMPNLLLQNDEYFVHFFAPSNLKHFRTHAIFVLDMSSSVGELKLSQIKSAMRNILSEMKPEDYFTLIVYSGNTRIWAVNSKEHKYNELSFNDVIFDDKDNAENLLKRYLEDNTTLIPIEANKNNINEAKKYINQLESKERTNVGFALNASLIIAHDGFVNYKIQQSDDTIKPIIFFLCEGIPNDDDQQELITSHLVPLNHANYSIYCFDYDKTKSLKFLKAISFRSNGFTKIIYHKSDAAVRIKNLYKEISTPLLSDISITYDNSQPKFVTTTSFKYFFNGSELMVAGKLKNPNNKINCSITAQAFQRKCFGPCYTELCRGPEKKEQRDVIKRFFACMQLKHLIDQFESTEKTEKKKEIRNAFLNHTREFGFITTLIQGCQYVIPNIPLSYSIKIFDVENNGTHYYEDQLIEKLIYEYKKNHNDKSNVKQINDNQTISNTNTQSTVSYNAKFYSFRSQSSTHENFAMVSHG
ncbi:inter-alpha-trypsin inhibitor heavy chain H5-like [Adelges cooleyi]|uniref:inter-alpha-trypsin inhibitor heavy chain H5-like n=1 Tax=Adelges cooleyi TaxID=133065 RepID=UPI0021809ADE|nr:inter-alpha-trypsin inhibitor heavy chain H5-like [Adelges cooleyi]